MGARGPGGAPARDPRPRGSTGPRTTVFDTTQTTRNIFLPGRGPDSKTTRTRNVQSPLRASVQFPFTLETGLCHSTVWIGAEMERPRRNKRKKDALPVKSL